MENQLQISLKRRGGNLGFTHGKLYFNGVYISDTLEDQERTTKIQNATAIPRGVYKVSVTYSNRFKRMMPLLENVPNFTGVRIHSGNTASDTEGCILVGTYLAQGYIKDSRIAYKKIFPLIDKAIKKGEQVLLTIS